MSERGTWTGSLLAGAAAGVAGTLAMNAYWRAVKKAQPASRKKSAEEPITHKVAADLLKKAGIAAPSRRARAVGGDVVHWSYGVTWGILAGLARQAGLKLDVAYGLPFGAALWAGGDVWALYKLGYAKHPREYPPHAHALALAAHLTYGMGVWAALTGLHQLTHTHLAERAGLPRAA